MFVDEVVLTVTSGKGGDGCISFRREAHVPKGGPNGGDGGAGGDVWVEASSQKNTLVDYRHVTNKAAKKGRPGTGSNKTGKSGEHLVLQVPPGTLVFDDTTGLLLADLDSLGARIRVATGGRGGRGNARFATSTNRAPRIADPGGKPETVVIRLELKLLADVGIIGFPSVGKSTLISRISSARPEIADYPFTTLIPNLGAVEKFPDFPFVVADVPGLIEGAHTGKGLGIRFLRHVQRTSVLLHMVDCTRLDPVDDWHKLRRELALFDPVLAEKPELVIINKSDTLPGSGESAVAAELAARFGELGRPCLPISAVTGEGLDRLLEAVAQKLKALKKLDYPP